MASPIYKQRFNLATGQCLDDNSVMLATYDVELDISFEGNDVIIKYEQLETSSTTLLEIEAV